MTTPDSTSTSLPATPSSAPAPSPLARFNIWFSDPVHRETFAIFTTILLQAVWSSLQATMKLLAPKIHGVTQATLRLGFSVPILLVLWGLFDARRDTVKPWAPFLVLSNWPYLLYIAGVGNALNLFMVSYAYQFPNTSAAVVGAVLALQTILVPLFGSCVGDDKLNWAKVAGLLLGFAGVIIILNPEKLYHDLMSGSGIGDYIGVILVVVNIIFFSSFIIVNRRFMRRNPGLSVISYQLGISTLATILIVILGGWITFPDLAKANLSGNDWGIAIYSAFAGSAVGYILNAFGMSSIRAPAVFSALQAVLPVTNTIMGVIWFNEPFTVWVGSGMAVIFCGIAVILVNKTLTDKKEKQAAEQAEKDRINELVIVDTNGNEISVTPIASVASSLANSNFNSEAASSVEPN